VTQPDTRCAFDYGTYKKYRPLSPDFAAIIPPKLPFDTRPAQLDINDPMTDKDFILLPPNIHGYVLSKQKFGET
jgi:hypothetical protein